MLPPDVVATPLALLGRFRPLAHHPDCARHDHHLLRVLGYPLCLGCVGLWTGLLGAGLLLYFGWPGWSALTHFGLALTCFAPTFGQPFVQKRWYKLPARTLLGIGFAFGIASLVAAPLSAMGWAMRLGFTAATWGIYRAASTLRERKTPDPCSGCPWGSFPLCTHNLDQLRALRDRDPVQSPFLSAVISDLEPLATVAPNFTTLPPRRGGEKVGFGEA
jgi:hypothetical protein